MSEATELLDELKELPKYAVVPGKGKCRVLAYEGNGYFTLLTNRDHKLYVHRGRCIFTNR